MRWTPCGAASPGSPSTPSPGRSSRRNVPVNGHVVKVGWFTPEIDPNKLLLLSCGTGRWDLLVVPPETGAESAARLKASASD
jgi:uncharacterized protein DUF5994